jgi:hypothetical protein
MVRQGPLAVQNANGPAPIKTNQKLIKGIGKIRTIRQRPLSANSFS